MLTINNDNFKQIVRLGFSHEESIRINNENRTTADIKRELTTMRNNEKILNLLAGENIDLGKELPDLRCELEEKNNYSKKSIRDENDTNFNIRLKMSFLEDYIKEHNPELIVEDEDIITNYEFYKELDLDDNRFSYEMWQISDESIEHLSKYCDIFNSSFEVINDFYLGDSEIKEIHCLRDNWFCKDYNLSKYVIFIENAKKHRFAVVVNHNGIRDAIIFGCEEIQYIIPLNGADKWRCREGDTNLNEKILKFIGKIESYRDVIFQG